MDNCRSGNVGDPPCGWDDGHGGGTVNTCEFVASWGKWLVVVTRLWVSLI